MNSKIFNKLLALSVFTLAMVVVPVLSHAEVSAETDSDTDISLGQPATATIRARVEAKMEERRGELEERARERAYREIDRRTEGLERLVGRVDDMKRVSTSTKTGLNATIQAQIDALAVLKTKIESDSGTTTLKSDIQSITKSYRIYALVIPQGAILAAADRIKHIADSMTTVSAKLEVRIDEAEAAGGDVTALASTSADLNAKIAEAKTQADAAISLTTGLAPDNGDEAVFQDNKKKLQEARTKLQAARAALRAAHRDIQLINKGLRTLARDSDDDTMTTTTATTTATTTP